MNPYYEHGGITIYHGDCMEIIPSVGPFDCVLTDPPYSSGARRDADRQVRGSMIRSMEDEDWFSHDAMTNWGFTWFMRGIMTKTSGLLSRGGHIYIFSDWRQTPNVYAILESCGYRVNHCLVWDKGHFGMGAYWRNRHENIIFASNGQPDKMIDKGRGSVLNCKNVRPQRRVHPTEKPTDLIRQIVSAIPSCNILDPFIGSGSTLVAAKRLGRQAIGIEVEERWCEIAAKRLGQETLNFGGEE